MTNVSRKKLRPSVSKTIDAQFIQTIARFDKRSAKKFLDDFFTAAERMMFAKRLAILLLLEEDFSPYRIAILLNVSTSTVRRVYARHWHGNTSPYMIGTDRKNVFFKEFRDFLFEGLSMSSKRRAKWLNDFEKKYG